jgi:hypothetical protein
MAAVVLVGLPVDLVVAVAEVLQAGGAGRVLLDRVGRLAAVAAFPVRAQGVGRDEREEG